MGRCWGGGAFDLRYILLVNFGLCSAGRGFPIFCHSRTVGIGGVRSTGGTHCFYCLSGCVRHYSWFGDLLVLTWFPEHLTVPPISRFPEDTSFPTRIDHFSSSDIFVDGNRILPHVAQFWILKSHPKFENQAFFSMSRKFCRIGML